MDIFSGYVSIEGAEYAFTFKNFIFTLSIGNRANGHIGWANVSSLVKAGWIHVSDVNQSELYLQVERAEFSGQGHYSYIISNFVQVFYLDRRVEKNLPFICNQMEIRHPIIDYMFAGDDSIIDRATTMRICTVKWKVIMHLS